MEARDLASNLEFWSGRSRHSGAGEDPQRRSRPGRRPRWSFPRAPKGRARPVAAAVLLAGLSAAWLVAGHSSRSSDALPVPAPVGVAPVAPATTAPRASAPGTTAPRASAPDGAVVRVPPTTAVPRTPDCSGLSATRVEVRCTIDAIDLDMQFFPTGVVTAAYEHATGVHPVPGSGPAACARGVPEERSWSAAATPAAAVGRYLCRFENGRAAMWWTQGPRLVHAVAPNGDLAGLFSWWRGHPSE